MTRWKTLGKTTKCGISLAVGKRSDGSLEVFAIDMSFNFWHMWQTGPGPDDWSEWTRLGRLTIKGQKIVVAKDKTDRLEAFAIDTSNRVWLKRQNNPRSDDWSDWERLAGGLAWDKAISLAVAPNKDDLLEVFAIDKSYHFWRIWQTDSGRFGKLVWVRLGGQSDRGTTLAVERNGHGRLEAFTIAIDAAGADPSSPKPSDIRHSFQDPITNDWTDWTGL